MDLQLTGRFAVVTGASRGIGLATARRLAAEGAHVLGVARTATAELKEVADVVVTADLATPDGADAVADAVPEWAPDGLDLLVNNAGGIALGGEDPAHLVGFATIDDDAWRRTLDLNLLSAVRVTRALIDHLLRRGGVIVNVSSVGARIAGPGTDYGVAKAGLTHLTKALSEEYAPRGLRAVTVSPGPTRTGMWTDPDRPAGDLARSLGIEHDQLLAALPQQMGQHRTPRRAGGDGRDHRVPRLSPGRRHHRSRHPRRRWRSQDRLTAGPSRSQRLPATSRNTATCP